MSIESQLSLKQLRAFVAVYRSGKLSLAATRLSVTESAVSTMLRQIEATLNLALFDRTSRALTPTQAAHDTIAVAERILRDVASLGSHFEALSDLRRGRVHIVVTATVAAVLMPAVVRRFSAVYPDVKIILDDCAPDQFLTRVAADHVDFGIGTPESDDPQLELVPLLHDHLCLVCADDHPLAGREDVTWADVAPYPLIAVRTGLGYGMRRKLDAAADHAGVRLIIGHEVNFLSSALWMTAGGLGVTIWASSLVAKTQHDNLWRCRLSSPRVPMDISYVNTRGRTLSPAAEGFLKVTREVFAEVITL